MKRDGKPVVRKFHKRLNTRRLSRLLTVLYVLSVIPILALGWYDYPAADDFSMGLWAHQAFASSGNFFAAVGAGLARTAWYYGHWQGDFTASFFMAVPPNVFAIRLYVLTPLLMVGMLTLAYLLFFHVLFVKMLGMDGNLANGITMLVLLVTMQCMPGSSAGSTARTEAFYWYNSSCGYTLLYSFGLIYLSLLLSLTFIGGEKKIGKLFLASLFGFLTGGGNYLTALSMMVLSVLVLFAAVLPRNREKRQWLLSGIPVLFLTAGFLISVRAPGNAVRAGSLEGMGPVKTVLVSLYYTLSYAVNQWTTWSVICFLLLMLPLFWKAAEAFYGNSRNGKPAAVTFRYPGIAVLLAFGFPAVSICPPLYAEGNIGAGRIQALFWMQYILCMVLLEGYLTGLIYGFSKEQKKEETPAVSDQQKNTDLSMTCSGSFCFILLLLVFGSGLAVGVNRDLYTSTAALTDLLNGHAAVYAQENEDRYALLEDPAIQDAVLPDFTEKPALLFYSDVSTDAQDWTNQAVARFFGKNSVILEEH